MPRSSGIGPILATMCSLGALSCSSEATSPNIPASTTDTDAHSDTSTGGSAGTAAEAGTQDVSNEGGWESGSNCDLGFKDCNGFDVDGCEIDTATDELHCGDCDQACPTAHTNATCIEGHCVLNCAEGFADCDAYVWNGCETALSMDAKHCGACNSPCLAGQVCGDGTCVGTGCPPGFGECNGDPTDLCETDLATSDEDCGNCGNSCSDAESCFAGSCVTPTSSLVLAEGEFHPYGMAVDDTRVYFIDHTNADYAAPDDSIRSVPKGGGAVMTLASEQTYPSAIACDGSYVYWTNYWNGTVRRVLSSGGTVETMAVGQDHPTDLSVDPTHVTWSVLGQSAGMGQVVRATTAGGPPAVFVDGQTSPWHITSNTDRVYWTVQLDPTDPFSFQGIRSIAKTGGGAETFVADTVSALAADEDHVYWCSTQGIRKSVAGASGSAVTISDEPCFMLQSDGTNLFVIAYDTVARLPVTGGSLAPVGKGVRLALDDTYVYWMTRMAGGVLSQLRRAPKE